MYRKHFFEYLKPISSIIILIIALFCFLNSDLVHKLVKIFDPSASYDISKYVLYWGNYFMIVLFAYVILRKLCEFSLLRSCRIEVLPHLVVYRSGFLRWAKREMRWQDFQIRACSYQEKRFLGLLISYGEISIFGREGMTSEVVIGGLSRPKECALAISRIVRPIEGAS